MRKSSLIILCLLLSGCAIPIKMVNYTSKEDILREVNIRNYQLRKEKYNKIYDKAIKRLSRKISQKNKEINRIKKLRYKISQIPDKKSVFIKAIMIESGLSEPNATILYENYIYSGIKGFSNYLIKENPFNLVDYIYIDFVKRVKVNTKILKRLK